MTTEEKKEINNVHEIVFQFCHDVLNEPLTFFSEADLQSLLYAKLYNSFGRLIETSYQRGSDSKTCYKTIQLHREYGLNESQKSRMDLVIFSEEDIKSINSPNLVCDGKYLKPTIGIELGTHKTANFKEHLENDVKKLKGVDCGYLIHIQRDETKSSKKSKSGQNTLDRIDTKITNAINETSIPDNIIPLFFIIQIQKRKIWGKCQYYNLFKRMGKY